MRGQEKRSTAQMMREMRQGGVAPFTLGPDEDDSEDDFFVPGAACLRTGAVAQECPLSIVVSAEGVRTCFMRHNRIQSSVCFVMHCPARE